MFCFSRGNEDLRKLTVCSALKRKIIFQGLAEEFTSMSEHFLHSDNVLSPYSFIQKINPNFEILYQKKTNRVKAAEEPEQNSTKICFPPVLVKLPHITALHKMPVARAYMYLQGDLPCGSGRTTVDFSYSPKCLLRTANAPGYPEAR